jgi:hypothetical protein
MTGACNQFRQFVTRTLEPAMSRINDLMTFNIKKSETSSLRNLQSGYGALVKGITK